MVVEEERRSVEADSRLPRSRPSLHGEQFGQRSADDLVLLGLDGGDDVEHLAGAGPLELGQERVPAPQPGRGGVVARSAEEVVGDRQDALAVDHDLPPPGEAQWVLGTRPVEGNGNGRSPVEHHRVGVLVLDVAAPDVPRRTLLFVDAPEEQWSRAVGEHGDPAGQGGHVVEVRIPGADEIGQQPLGPLPHGAQGAHGSLEVLLLSLELGIGMRGRNTHGSQTTEQITRKRARANIPGHSGDIKPILRLLQAL